MLKSLPRQGLHKLKDQQLPPTTLPSGQPKKILKRHDTLLTPPLSFGMNDPVNLNISYRP